MQRSDAEEHDARDRRIHRALSDLLPVLRAECEHLHAEVRARAGEEKELASFGRLLYLRTLLEEVQRVLRYNYGQED